MKDYLFGLATLVLIVAIGWVLWTLTSTTSSPTPSTLPSFAASSDAVLHQQNLEAKQDETNRLLVMLVDTTLLVNPSPTPLPTKAPTATPRATVAVVTCGEWLEAGTVCELPKVKLTPTAKPTQTPVVDCSLTTPTQFSRDYCLWMPTPIPWNPLEGK